MSSRTRASSCCMYTTRSYDLDGNTRWSGNYFQGLIGVSGFVRCQAIDSTHVYVGGDRVTSNHSWSLTCFDLVNGQLLWDRDLLIGLPAGDRSGGVPLQIRIDGNGDLVCLMKNNSSGSSIQTFVRVHPDGTLKDIIQFSLQVAVTGPAELAQGADFVINQNGDYHILCGNYNRLYEWSSPFSSAPILSGSIIVGPAFGGFQLPRGSIVRADSRDYFGGTVNTDQLFRGTRRAAAPMTAADFDLLIPVRPIGTSASASGSGTTQSGATPLVVGNRYVLTSTSTNNAFVLPTSHVGDVISVSSLSGSTPRIYAPPGGIVQAWSADTSGVNGLTPQLASDMHFYGLNDGNWLMVASGRSKLALRIGIDSSNNILATTPGPNVSRLGGLIKYDSNGTPQWIRGYCALNIACDPDGNVYTAGYRSNSDASVVARDPDGNWLWGHKHSGQTSIALSSIDYDPTEDTLIVSGCRDDAPAATFGACKRQLDQNFVPDPWP